MARRSKLLDIKTKRCRICLADNGFMVKLRDKFVEPKLKDLTKCTCIDIEYKKNLPDGVCHICFYKLSMWTEFKELFMQSHKILLEQLEISEAPDNAVNNSSKDNRHLKRKMKRTNFNKSDDDSTSAIDKKRSKIDVSSSEVINTDEAVIDTIYISDSEDESIISKDSPEKTCNIDRRKLNKNVKNDNEEHVENKSTLESKKFISHGKIKRRQIALKNWERRRKALYNATQKSVSDSESNDVQLTPVRKTQIKTNEDKEAKKKKRVASLLRNLETNLASKYIGFDVSTPRTRLRNQAMVLPSEKNSIETETRKYSTERESSPSLPENNITANGARKPISQTNINTFTPKSSKTELVIGKTTFIVTSNLILQDQQYNQTLNNSKNSESLNGDVNSNENIDIFDAVQLRRVSPVIIEKKGTKETMKNDIERCLDIRIESREFAMLKHMQVELSDFIQKEVKQKFLTDGTMKTDSVNNTKSQPKLDQKLKNLIQNAIEKNIERITNENDARCQEFQRISPEFVKTAIHLPQYQPKVVVERLNLAKINNALKRTAPTSKSQSTPPRKRLIVLPKKYNDFNTSLEFNDLEDTMVQETPRAAPRTHKNSTMKCRRKVILEKQIQNNDSIVTTNKDKNAMSVSPVVKEGLKVNGEKIAKTGIEIKNLGDTETFLCKICKFRCYSKKNIMAHVRESHITPSEAEDNDEAKGLTNKEKIDKNDVEIKNSTDPEIYLCQICKFTCNSVKDIETHVRESHVISSEAVDPPQNINKNTATLPQNINKNTVTLLQNINKNTVTLPQNINKNTVTLPQNINKNTATLPREKQKKMRCKKCHEIVEYQGVKAHVFSCKLKMPHLIYVCPICKANFKVKKLFLQHFETHRASKSTNIIRNKEINNVDASLQRKTAVPTMPQESHTVGLQLPTVSEALQKGYAIQTNKKGICVTPLKKQTNETNVQSITIDKSNIQSNKVTATDAKSNIVRNIVQKNKEYSCFLCEKLFTDGELLKDHLQQHCDEQSDEEQNNKKDPYKCTICGNILNSDEAEEHMCKHWFDGEDSNNLNKTSLNDKRNDENNSEDSTSTEDEFYQCSQCWELFDSELLLEMHTRVHVEKIPTKEIPTKKVPTKKIPTKEVQTKEISMKEKQIIYQYQCTLCDDLLDTEKDLADHINLHNGNAQICQLCDKPFRTLEELQEHVSTHV